MSGNSVNSVTFRSGFRRLAMVAAAVPAPPPPMTIRRSVMGPPWLGTRCAGGWANVFETQQKRLGLAHQLGELVGGTSAAR